MLPELWFPRFAWFWMSLSTNHFIRKSETKPTQTPLIISKSGKRLVAHFSLDKSGGSVFVDAWMIPQKVFNSTLSQVSWRVIKSPIEPKTAISAILNQTSMVLFFGGTSLVETTYLVTDIKEVTQGIAIPLK